MDQDKVEKYTNQTSGKCASLNKRGWKEGMVEDEVGE